MDDTIRRAPNHTMTGLTVAGVLLLFWLCVALFSDNLALPALFPFVLMCALPAYRLAATGMFEYRLRLRAGTTEWAFAVYQWIAIPFAFSLHLLVHNGLREAGDFMILFAAMMLTATAGFTDGAGSHFRFYRNYVRLPLGLLTAFATTWLCIRFII